MTITRTIEIAPYAALMGPATRFLEADNAWHAELVERFGTGATAARYERRGRGSFDDRLGVLWLARDKARLVWEARP